LQENTETQNKTKESGINQIYDKILKRILTLSARAVLNLINGLFGTNFPLDSKIVYNWTESVDDKLGRTIADTILTIYVGEDIYRFHIEAEIDCGSTNDISIVLRVFDYGYRDALKHREVGKDKITLKFPQPKIILLEHNSNSPDEVTLELDFGTKGKIDFTVPTVKFLEYSIDELNAQRMVILLPLYLLKLRREIEKAIKQGTVRKNAQSLKDLINDNILKTIDENEKAGHIDSYDAYVLAGLVKKLYDHLYGNIKEFEEEGVKSALEDMLLVDYEEEIINAVSEAVSVAVSEKALEIALDIATTLLGRGMPPSEVADITKLPVSRIEKLQLQLVPV